MDGTSTSESPPSSPEVSENSANRPSEKAPSTVSLPTVVENLTQLETEPKRTQFGDLDRRLTNPHLFQPGQVVPGSGRPKGSKNKITLWKLFAEESLREQAAEHLSDVLAKAISMAKKGHPGMIKLLLELHMSKNTDTDDRSVDDKITININQIEPIKTVSAEKASDSGSVVNDDSRS